MVQVEASWATAMSVLRLRAQVGEIELATERHLRQHCLRIGEYLVLLALSNELGATARGVDLAKRMGITSGGVTRLVNRAARYGYVGRRPNPADRRSTLVWMTPLGQQRLDAATPGLSELAAPLVVTR